MAYMNQERKRQIAAALKPVLGRYGVKATLSVAHHAEIVMTIKSSQFDFLKQYRERTGYDATHYELNTYHLDRDLDGEALSFAKDALNALRAADWYDRSEIQSDYFDMAYHISIRVGRWDKPYQLITDEEARS